MAEAVLADTGTVRRWTAAQYQEKFEAMEAVLIGHHRETVAMRFAVRELFHHLLVLLQPITASGQAHIR